ncbi:MAG TPA: SIS domain-containing protein [Candidatus Saccharibacteria bacterium]|nr:SIS domain-containing protein [Candidatus Saccharibacteria bacterium]HMT39703.1 SIS domain-containing protein [Candidatus Saccharibacteria bacterium]
MSQKTYADLESIDKQNIFDVIDSQPNQLRQNYADTLREDITKTDGINIKNIVFIGMGGSALAGSIAHNWLSPRLLVPFTLIRGESLPEYVDHNSLVIISSYSGNTHETILAFVRALRLNARVIVLTCGGELFDLAKKAGVTVLQLPKISQPRLSVFAGLKALACILQDTELISGGDLRRELIDAADHLDTKKLLWGSDKEGDNLAKTIAQSMHDKSVIIYSSPLLSSAGYKWKIDINETAKQMAFNDTFSELNHNEMQGWKFPTQKQYASVVLNSEFETSEMEKRIKLTKTTLSSYGYSPTTVVAQGQNHIQQLLYTTLLGDFVSAYLAILNKVDPTPVEIIEKFKKNLELKILE